MLRITGARSSAVMLLLVIAALTVPPLAHAQDSARLFGVVTDPEGNPVDEATIIITFEGGFDRQYEITTNSQGEWLQMGLMRGPYRVEASKEGVGATTGTTTLRTGQVFEMDMQMLTREQIMRETMTDEELAELDATLAANAAVEGALEASRAGNLDEAIEGFTAALAEAPDCADCHRALGIIYVQTEDYDRAEASFNEALALNPEDASAYDRLARLYNAQRRFDEAAEAAAAAVRLSGGAVGEGTDAGAVFDQGLISWNAGRVDEARQQFERTLELDPNHGEAHYWLGMANLNGGQMAEAAAEFKLYIDREPNGRFAEQATGILTQIAP